MWIGRVDAGLKARKADQVAGGIRAISAGVRPQAWLRRSLRVRSCLKVSAARARAGSRVRVETGQGIRPNTCTFSRAAKPQSDPVNLTEAGRVF